MIPEEKLQELKERIDITDLVGRYVGLKRAGKNFAACCPFHSERTPSFYVNPERRSYKCFGCGVWGTGIDFVMQMEGKSFLEACRQLAQLYGVQLPSGLKDNTSTAQQNERDEAYAINRTAAELYREILLHGDEGQLGRLYQERRGITAETAEAFQLGYAPAPAEAGWDRLTNHLQRKSLSLPLAEKLGLVARSERNEKFYDKFRGRLMFPVVQPGGAVIAFSGRILPEYAAPDADGREAPKYTNSPESLLYTKGKTLFGLHLAGQNMRRAGRAILVEGNVDVVTMHQRGYRETVAPLGTALTAQQVTLLGRFAESCVLCFDGDSAGRKAARNAIPLLLDAGIEARIVALEGGVDPDTADAGRLAALLEQPGSALEWLMRWMVAAGARDSIDAQDRALSALAPLLAKVKRDGARELYIDRAAKLLGLPPGRISSALQGSREAPRPHNHRDSNHRDSNHRDSNHRDSNHRDSNHRDPNHRDPNHRDPNHRDSNHRDPNHSDSQMPSGGSAAGPAGAAGAAGPAGPHGAQQRSGPARPLPELPRSQVALAALLVDNPHLASLAEQQRVRDYVTDPRLAPIVGAVIDAAFSGDSPGVGELLELVEVAAHRQVHDALFAGRYRDEENPQEVLDRCLFDCRLESLELRRNELAVRVSQAIERGEQPLALALSRERGELNQQLAALKRLSTDLPPSATHAQPARTH